MPTATEQETSNTELLPTKVLSFNQSIVVFLLVSLWLMAFIMLLVVSQVTTSVLPTLWIYSSSILFLIGLIKRFQASIKATLSIHFTHYKWIVISILLAVVYWNFDQWLMRAISPGSSEVDISSWQKQLQNYHIAMLFISSVLLAPVFEELLFRGLLLSAIKTKINFILAMLLTSLLFALIHWSWPEFISLMLAGCLYALLVHYSKTIVTAVLAHIIHNALTFWQYAAF